MTDQEYKIDILRKNAIKLAAERGHEPEFTNEQFNELVKEKDFISWITLCMDEWAGVISARIDESDREEEDNGE